VDVLLELPNDVLAELSRLCFVPRGIFAGHSADVHGEPNVRGVVVAEMVRLSIMPELFVTAMPRPPLIAWMLLSMSSIDWFSSPSKVMVKST
jgi:hypothetical protein